MFKKLKNWFKIKWNAKKWKVYQAFVIELKTFTNENVDNPTVDKRLWSLYYFLGQHDSYDALITTLHRFLNAKSGYSKSEILLIKLLLLKLELPFLWLNRIIYPVKMN